MCTQAWCKFYEILGTFPAIARLSSMRELNTVHLCEAPGAFVASLNHFLVCRGLKLSAGLSLLGLQTNNCCQWHNYGRQCGGSCLLAPLERGCRMLTEMFFLNILCNYQILSHSVALIYFVLNEKISAFY